MKRLFNILILSALLLSREAYSGANAMLDIKTDNANAAVYTAEGYFLGRTPLKIPIFEKPRLLIVKDISSGSSFSRMTPERNDKPVLWDIHFAGYASFDQEDSKYVEQDEAAYYQVTLHGLSDQSMHDVREYLEQKFFVRLGVCDFNPIKHEQSLLIGPTNLSFKSDLLSWAKQSNVEIDMTKTASANCAPQAPSEPEKVIPAPVKQVIVPMQKIASDDQPAAEAPQQQEPQASKMKHYKGHFVQVRAMLVDPQAVIEMTRKLASVDSDFKTCRFEMNGQKMVRYYKDFSSKQAAKAFVTKAREQFSDAFYRSSFDCN